MGAVHPLEIDAAFFPWWAMQTAMLGLDKTLDFDMARVETRLTSKISSEGN